MASLNPYYPVVGISLLVSFAVWMCGRRIDTLKDAFDSLTGAIIAFGMLCLSPFFLYASWHQAWAKERLLQASLPVSPGLGYAVGAQGGRSPRFVWRFQARDNPSAILNFYADETKAAGWKVERRKNGMLLTKAGASFALWTEKHSDGEQIVIEKQLPKAGS